MGTLMTNRNRYGTGLLALAAAMLLAACRQGPGPAAESPPRRSGPLETPPAVEAPRARQAPPEPAAPPGIYFLHEPKAEPTACAFVGERLTGGDAPSGSLAGEQARARAVLDLAEQARWMGGNVVALPNFREDFRAGRLLGRVYRCNDDQRRRLYEQGSAEQRLTVLPP